MNFSLLESVPFQGVIMGTSFLNQIKKQSSLFLHEKYKHARLALTDVTPAELLAEEATNNDPLGPDAKTMTKIAEASYELDDYWRIVEVLHKRFYNINWKEWRQSYKTLVLLEFLLTHGPEEFAQEFQSDSNKIEELGTFKFIDQKGFDWGANMRKRSDNIITLLDGGVKLKDARFKALKITKEIQGFGNFMTPFPPSSSISSPSSATSDSSRASSFGSYSTTSSTYNDIVHSPTKQEDTEKSYYLLGSIFDEINEGKSTVTSSTSNKDLQESSHVWNSSAIQETGRCLLDSEGENDDNENQDDGIFCKVAGERESFGRLSDFARLIKKKCDRQFSMGY